MKPVNQDNILSLPISGMNIQLFVGAWHSFLSWNIGPIHGFKCYTQESHITLEFLIEQLSIQLSTNESLAQCLNPSNTAEVAFASLDNQIMPNSSSEKLQDSQAPAISNNNNKKKKQKPCICVYEQTHLYHQCPYIIEINRLAGLECHSQPTIPAPEPIPTRGGLGNGTKPVSCSGNWEWVRIPTPIPHFPHFPNAQTTFLITKAANFWLHSSGCWEVPKLCER